MQDRAAWGNLKTGAWCYYDNDSSNGTKYGKLYNWYAVNDPRGLAPNGYHIPSDVEWTKLADYLGGENKAGKKIKNTSGWRNDGNGTNSSGFSGLPGGQRDYDGTFNSIGGGYLWSSAENDAANAWYRDLSGWDGKVGRYYSNKRIGFSVRCLRD